MILSGRSIIIITMLTLFVWIGYETYSTLTKSARQLVVRQELLKEVTKGNNEEVLTDLSNRISY